MSQTALPLPKKSALRTESTTRRRSTAPSKSEWSCFSLGAIMSGWRSKVSNLPISLDATFMLFIYTAISPLPAVAAISTGSLISAPRLVSSTSQALPFHTANETTLRLSTNLSENAAGCSTIVSVGKRCAGTRFETRLSSYATRGSKPFSESFTATVNASAPFAKSPGVATADALYMGRLNIGLSNTAIERAGFAASETEITGSDLRVIPWSFQSQMKPPWKRGSFRSRSQ